MALRQIRIDGDPVLGKKCREVKEMTPRIKTLVDDMLETMYDAGGVGLAAPQVGILRRIAVIDVGDGPVVLINPVIVSREGEQTGPEGCLSVPGKAGDVTRPERVCVKAQDAGMNSIELEAEGFFARAVCHELDHLDGILYTSLVEGDLYDVTDEEENEDGNEGAASQEEGE